MSKLNEVATAEQLELTGGADKAIVRLSGGDMRKVLNILESCSLAYKTIPIEKVYEVTGRPSPQDIQSISNCLTNQEFTRAYDEILQIKKTKSLGVDDIVRDVHAQIMLTKQPDQMKMFLCHRLSEIEYRLAQGSNERGQIASLVGAFVETRTIRA